MTLKPYKITFLQHGIQCMYIYDLSKYAARNSVIKHWNSNLVYGAKIISIEEVSEEDVKWGVYQGEEE